jgi:hypothetical protein
MNETTLEEKFSLAEKSNTVKRAAHFNSSGHIQFII